MKYGFVDDVSIGYEKLHTKYYGLEIATSESEKLTWRDDYTNFYLNYACPTNF